MLQVALNLPELRKFAKSLPTMKDQVLSLMQLDIKTCSQEMITALMSAELSLFLGRQKYERKTIAGIDANSRNGFYERTFFLKHLGALRVKVPRDRQGEFKSQVLPKYQRVDNAIQEDCSVLFLMGLSTRSLSLVSEKIFGRKLSHSEISNCTKDLSDKVEAWRMRPITEEIKYLYMDGTNFKMRVSNEITKVCVLVVIGVTQSNHKVVLALQAGDKESATTWRELFGDLKKRGLQKDKIKLGIMDGLPGLESVFKDEFSDASVQRCQVHLASNVLTKTPHNIRKKVADDLRSIFYASSKSKAIEFYKEFESKWASTIPSGFKCLKNNLDSALTYLKFPEEEWLSLRTTNPIERLNKEFKRRTKTMEIVAGETSCYNLLAVVSMKMEAHWKENPINSKEFPWFLGSKKFTQLN